MSLLAIALISISAFMHAAWNLLSKSRHPSAAFFLVATLTGTLLLSPAVALSWETVVHGIPYRVWTLIIVSGFFLALYFVSLAGAYRAGDMSVAYPLSRSSPVLVVLVVTLILGRGEQVSGICIAGIVLVVGGCFLVPLHQFHEFRLRNYWNATCGLGLLAAVGTSGYSILDDEALRQLRADSQVTIGNTWLTLMYGCLEGLAASLWLTIIVAIRRNGRERLRHVLNRNARDAALTGIAIYLTYTLVLISMSFVNNVSYVVGFRQLSIPLGATLGVLVLKESPHPPKLAGVAIMFVGLLLVATG